MKGKSSHPGTMMFSGTVRISVSSGISILVIKRLSGRLSKLAKWTIFSQAAKEAFSDVYITRFPFLCRDRLIPIFTSNLIFLFRNLRQNPD